MATSTAGERKVLARYEADEGERQLVAQRINGRVALSDVPAGGTGPRPPRRTARRRLDELDALVEDYLAKAAECGRCPMAPGAWWGD